MFKLISKSLLPTLLFHNSCHLFTIYLLIKGLKFEYGNRKFVGCKLSEYFAFWSTFSLPAMTMWLGIQQYIISLYSAISLCFSSSF